MAHHYDEGENLGTLRAANRAAVVCLSCGIVKTGTNKDERCAASLHDHKHQWNEPNQQSEVLSGILNSPSVPLSDSGGSDAREALAGNLYPGKIISVVPESLDQTLSDRGAKYGDFRDHAAITQQLKEVVRQAMFARHAETFTPIHREAIDMILHKIGRILNGDPNYADSWTDIAGYAKLVADRLETK